MYIFSLLTKLLTKQLYRGWLWQGKLIKSGLSFSRWSISHGPCRLGSLTDKWTCHSLHCAFIYLACNATVRTQNEHAGRTAVRGVVPFLRGGEDNDEGQQCTHCPVERSLFHHGPNRRCHCSAQVAMTWLAIWKESIVFFLLWTDTCPFLWQLMNCFSKIYLLRHPLLYSLWSIIPPPSLCFVGFHEMQSAE